MKKTLTKALLGLALLALFIPAAGCDLRDSSYALGSFSDVVFGFDIAPVFGGFDYFEEEYDYTEFEIDFFDDYSGYDDYDDGYYDDGYYYDGFGGYDDWKKKSAG